MTARLLQMSGVVADLLYQVDRVPTAGEEAIVSGFTIAPGGGFNAMVAARRSGMMVSYGGSVGSGPFARIVRDGLNAEGIPFLQPQDLARDQGCCSVLIDRNGERTFVAGEGAEGHVTAEDLERISFADFDWTLLSGYALHYAGSRGALHDWLASHEAISNLVFDPSPVAEVIPRPALQAALDRAIWISANAREATVLTGLSDPAEAARSLASTRPATGGAVVRNGAKGCIVAIGNDCRVVAPFPVRAIDTNGAGDTHVGCFIARLARCGDPFDAAEYANIAAAISTTVQGPATAPSNAEVVRALQQKQAG